LKQRGHILDRGSNPRTSTIDTLRVAGQHVSDCGIRRGGKCIFDGGELGSTGVKVKWSLPDDLVSVD